MTSRFLAGVVVVLAVTPASAEDWKTSDGKISLTVPAAGRFNSVAPDEEQSVAWQSNDGTLTMAFGEFPFPANVLPRQSEIEKGFVKELDRALTGTKLVTSSVVIRNGYDVFTMTARGQQDGKTVYCSQTLTTFGGKGYKAIVVGFDRNTQTDPDASKFIASFKILAPPPATPPGGVTPNPNPREDPGDRIAYNAGQVAGMCLFVAFIVWLFRRPARKPDKPLRVRRRDGDRPRRPRDEELDDE